MNSALYIGQVYHKRRRPAVHVLRYKVFSLLLNLDEIDSLQKRFWFFSRNRWNLFSFYDKDFGVQSPDASPREKLHDYVAQHLEQAGIHQKAKTTLLSCYPRVCGYTFNPLSLFYCFDENDQIFAVLHEVHNTFGERHVYVLPVVQESDVPAHSDVSKPRSIEWINQAAKKELFVSPFAHMNMNYRFRLNAPEEKQVIVIHVDDEVGHFLTASYTAVRRELTSSAFLKCFFVFPALTAKVTIGIHWEALRLFIKKVPWFSHQAKQSFSSNNLKNS